MASKDFNWHECDQTMAHELTAATVNPGYVYPYPLSALPTNMQASMPGLCAAFVSGYAETSAVRSDFTALGEFAVARVEGETAKGYNYAFGISTEGCVYFAGPFKQFPEHHWSTTQPIPVEKLFGYSGHYYKDDSTH